MKAKEFLNSIYGSNNFIVDTDTVNKGNCNTLKMKTFKTMHLKVENYILRKENIRLNKKLKKLEDEFKNDIEIINYLSSELTNYYNNYERMTDELKVEIHNLRGKVDDML